MYELKLYQITYRIYEHFIDQTFTYMYISIKSLHFIQRITGLPQHSLLKFVLS